MVLINIDRNKINYYIQITTFPFISQSNFCNMINDQHPKIGFAIRAWSFTSGK